MADTGRLDRMEVLVGEIHEAIVGSADGLKAGFHRRADDHDRRIKSLESLRAWILGLGTTMTGAGGVWALIETLKGKH